MRYIPPPSALFINNRKRLLQLLPAGALVIVHSNDQLPSNGDGTMPFLQNSNFYYLSGIDQAESILLLCPNSHLEDMREVLFLRYDTSETQTWDGEKLTPQEATALSGISNIRPVEDFEKTYYPLICESEKVFLQSNEHYRSTSLTETRNARFIAKCKAKYPLHSYHRLAPLTAQLRSVKAPEEVTQIRRACALTASGFLTALQSIKPGKKEYEIEASYLGHFVARGSRGFAYAPIIAGGINACTLHYVSNDAICQKGTLLLMDVGAEYGNYRADMTRCAPVSGTFSPRQRAIYDTVLRVMRRATELLKPGVHLLEHQKQVEQIVEKELCTLGVLSLKEIKKQDPKHPAYKRYFMHGVSHHLGLDTHDTPAMYQPLQAGAVLTVEPGIYIREEGIGVRLENDLLITKAGVENLMQDIPIEAEEIEQIMNKKS